MYKKRNLRHIPVLLDETIKGLDINKGKKYIDATLGSGGHASEIIKKGGLLLGLDRDPEAIKKARKRLEKAYPVLYKPVKNQLQRKSALKIFQPELHTGNFSDLEKIANENGFTNPAGILFDLGISSEQLEKKEKGLSFASDAPLDMRLDPQIKISAKDIINKQSVEELYELFIRNTQEELARPIAKAIISARNLKPIETTEELAKIVIQVKPRNKNTKIHPATKVFLALRMEVNQEIANLKNGLKQAIDILEPHGRLVVLSFHETEDRLVKQTFKMAKKNKKLTIKNKKPITPTQKEILTNPRSRSAKLRIAEKI